MANESFENFLKHFATDKNERMQMTRLKVLERRGLLRNNNSIKSGSSLSFVSSSVISNPSMPAGEKYSSMYESEKQKVRTIIRNLVDTFNSAASSTLA
jgi:hypothetical protein